MRLNSLLDFVEIPKEFFSDKTGDHILFLLKSRYEQNMISLLRYYKPEDLLAEISVMKANLLSVHELTELDLVNIFLERARVHSSMPIIFKESIVNDKGEVFLNEDFGSTLPTQKMMKAVDQIKNYIYSYPIAFFLKIKPDSSGSADQMEYILSLCSSEDLKNKITAIISTYNGFRNQEDSFLKLLSEESEHFMSFYENHQELTKKLDQATNKILQDDFTAGLAILSQIYQNCHEELRTKFKNYKEGL